MKTIDDIRRENLIALRDQHGTAQVLADIMEISPTQISQWINAAIDFKSGKPRNISSRSCRKMELKLDLVSGWMDTDHRRSEPLETPSEDPEGAVPERSGIDTEALDRPDNTASLKKDLIDLLLPAIRASDIDLLEATDRFAISQEKLFSLLLGKATKFDLQELIGIADSLGLKLQIQSPR